MICIEKKLSTAGISCAKPPCALASEWHVTDPTQLPLHKEGILICAWASANVFVRRFVFNIANDLENKTEFVGQSPKYLW